MYFGTNRLHNSLIVSGHARPRSRARKPRVVHWSHLAFIFSPGLFFVAIGISAIIAPQLVLAAIAAFFLFLGGVFCFVAWKVIKFKSRFERVAKNLEAKIVLQALEVRQYPEDDFAGEHKKVIYH